MSTKDVYLKEKEKLLNLYRDGKISQCDAIKKIAHLQIDNNIYSSEEIIDEDNIDFIIGREKVPVQKQTITLNLEKKGLFKINHGPCINCGKETPMPSLNLNGGLCVKCDYDIHGDEINEEDNPEKDYDEDDGWMDEDDEF